MNTELNNIYSKEFKAVLKELVDTKKFKRDVLFNGVSSSCEVLNDTQKEELSKRFSSWVNDNIISCNNDEVEFILSLGGHYDEGQHIPQPPYSWEDVTNRTSFNYDGLICDIEQDFNNVGLDLINKDFEENIETCEDLTDFIECEYNNEMSDFEDFIFQYFNLDVNDYEESNEVCQWFKVTGWLCEKLEEEGEQTIQSYNYWGRGTCGQSVELDWCIQEVFLKWWCN